MDEVAVKSARRLLPLYIEHMQPLMNIAAKSASCRRGCSHCCHNLVGSTLAEGILIADHLRSTPEFIREIPLFQAKLREQTRFINGLSHDMDSRAYFVAKRPCVFLDQEKGECRIYEVRPAACRSYYVVSDPANCSPDRPGSEVAFIDFQVPTIRFIHSMLEETKAAIQPVTGALQAMILMGFEVLDRTPEDFRSWLSTESASLIAQTGSVRSR